MAAWIALLRGVNVGGKGKLPMADLRRIAEASGFGDVETYIQSGNLVFTAQGAAAKLAAKLRKAIADDLGLDVPVLIRTHDELADVVAQDPFADPEHTHVVFLDAPAALFETSKYAPERALARGREVYLHLPNGVGRSKLAADVGRKLPAGTARSWRTVEKLLGLAGTRAASGRSTA